MGENSSAIREPLTIPGGLIQWREAVRRMPVGAIKQSILRIQQGINGMDFEKMASETEREANQKVLAMLLRRQTILIHELRARGKHTDKDNKDLHDWLEKEAKPGKKIF